MPQRRDITKSPTKNLIESSTLEHQDPALRRRSSLRFWGTSNDPFPISANGILPNQQAAAPVHAFKTSNLGNGFLRDNASEGQHPSSLRGTKRKSSTSPLSPRKRQNTPLLSPPEIQRAVNSQTQATSPAGDSRRASLRSSNPGLKVPNTPEQQEQEGPRGTKRKASTSPQSSRKQRTALSPDRLRDQQAPTSSPALDVVRRRSTLRSYISETPAHIPYEPRPYPPGVILPAGVVSPLPAIIPGAKREEPKYTCRRGEPRCGLEFPSRAKLHAHQHADHGEVPLGWLAKEMAKEVSQGRRTVVKVVGGRTQMIHGVGRATLQCQLCYEQVASTERLNEHLEKVHKIKKAVRRKTRVVSNVETDTLECHICHEGLASNTNLYEHLEKVHRVFKLIDLEGEKESEVNSETTYVTDT